MSECGKVKDERSGPPGFDGGSTEEADGGMEVGEAVGGAFGPFADVLAVAGEEEGGGGSDVTAADYISWGPRLREGLG